MSQRVNRGVSVKEVRCVSAGGERSKLKSERVKSKRDTEQSVDRQALPLCSYVLIPN